MRVQNDIFLAFKNVGTLFH